METHKECGCQGTGGLVSLEGIQKKLELLWFWCLTNGNKSHYQEQI